MKSFYFWFILMHAPQHSYVLFNVYWHFCHFWHLLNVCVVADLVKCYVSCLVLLLYVKLVPVWQVSSCVFKRRGEHRILNFKHCLLRRIWGTLWQTSDCCRPDISHLSVTKANLLLFIELNFIFFFFPLIIPKQFSSLASLCFLAFEGPSIFESA